jgi:hypothetical protein
MVAQSRRLNEVGVGSPPARGTPDCWASLERLDRLLEGAVERAREIFSAESVADPFKGLHISATDIARAIRKPAGEPMLWTGEFGSSAVRGQVAHGAAAELQSAFGLDGFDLDVVLITLAPELDLRYERIYAFLHNDVTRRRPSVDLALDLLCSSKEQKLARRERFAPDAPLVHNQIIELVSDPQQVRPPLLAHAMKLDEQITRFLTGAGSLDPRLARHCELIVPDVLVERIPVDSRMTMTLEAVVQRNPLDPGPQLHLHGGPPAYVRQIASALAGGLCSPLLIFDVSQPAVEDRSMQHLLELAFREARLLGAVLLIQVVEALQQPSEGLALRALEGCLSHHDGVVILGGGAQPWRANDSYETRLLNVALERPAVDERRRHWERQTVGLEIGISSEQLDFLADRFALFPNQIDQAVRSAAEELRWRSKLDTSPDAQALQAALAEAAREQCRVETNGIARRIAPKYVWSDMVLPPDTVAQLHELCERERHRGRVMYQWGFDQKLSRGKGTTALFAGPSGTGKTMAAEVIANDLGLDLFAIELSGVMSKYIGETEKNLDRIFKSIDNAILFFDEADALFGKRTEVHDSHDRYANVEVSHLLQKMEEYEGVAILGTNLRQNLDESLLRRLSFTVHFPFPDEAHRGRIWRAVWPTATPLAVGIDFEWLAERFKLSGGNIRNIALAAAFLAATGGSDAVTMQHILHATRREYQKLGKTLTADEVRCPAGDLRVPPVTDTPCIRSD